MLFNSFPFAILVLLTMLVYYIPAFMKMQRYVLLTSSLIFYAYDQPWLVLLLITSILINTVSSYHILCSDEISARKRWAMIGVILNLGILLAFKYSPLAATSLGLNAHDIGIGAFLINLPLPIGISFFTFQGISLVVDVYRQKPGEPGLIQRPDSFWPHLLDTAFFKSFFPQLVAGPIVKAHDFYPQIKPKYFTEIPWELAFRSLVLGYFLKMVIADNLKDFTFWMAHPYFLKFSSTVLVTMLFGYSIQIFADFAGYSLIAIGTARLFGYKLQDNFNYPYISQSISEFWRRWHISLSTWLKEYLYIPLGGNRKGAFRTYFNLILVMVLGGLWHGAAWSYAVWGLYHGLGLAVERLFTQKKRGNPDSLRAIMLVPFKMLGVFTFVTLGWLTFKLPEFSQVIEYLRAITQNFEYAESPQYIAYILFYSIPVIAYHLYYLWRSRFQVAAPRWAQEFAYAGCLVALLLNSGSQSAFIYFQF